MSEQEFFEKYEAEPLTRALLEPLRTCVIRHPHYEEVLHEVLTHVQMGNPKRLLLVMGPSGSGKSTLSEMVYSAVFDWPETQKKGAFPVWVEAPPPSGSTYSFRPFYEELLLDLHEPLPGYKVDPEERRAKRRKHYGARVIRSTSGARHYVNMVLREKAPPVILVDEADHFGSSSSVQERIDAMNVIKSITGKNKTKMIFFGTLEAQRLRHLNGALSRRVKTVHFGPYGFNDEDHQSFFSTYSSICTHVGIPTNVGREYAMFLHKNTFGAIGILSQWIDDAIIKAIKYKRSLVTIEDFLEAAPDEETLNLIRKETLIHQATCDSRRRRLVRQINTLQRRDKPGKRKPTHRDKAGEGLR